MAPTQKPSEPTLVLSNPSQWYQWISEIETSATLRRVWDLVDPSQSTEPLQPTPPIRPTEEELEKYLDEKKDSLVTMKLNLYNSKEKEYYRQIQFLSAIMTQIRKSISNDYAIHIQGKNNPYQALRALKLQIEPDPFTRAYETDSQYRALCNGPSRGQGINSWLNKWQSIYAEAKATRHTDFQSGRVLDQFIMSVSKVDYAWAKSAYYDLEKERNRGQEPKFEELVTRFRKTIQKEAATKVSTSTSFATLQSQRPPSQEYSTQGAKSSSSSRPVPLCICGKYHWFSQCFYILKSIRPDNWEPDPTTFEQVEEALKNPEIKAKVERVKLKNAKTKPRQVANLAIDQQDSRADYTLSNSWVLDTVANVHVCNDLSQFDSTYSAPKGDTVKLGKSIYPVEVYGKVRVNVTSPTEVVNYITLNDVAYVPGFVTSAISYSKAKKAQVHWDRRRDTLYTEKDGKQNHFCKLDLIGAHYVIQHKLPKTKPYFSPGEAPLLVSAEVTPLSASGEASSVASEETLPVASAETTLLSPSGEASSIALAEASPIASAESTLSVASAEVSPIASAEASPVASAEA